MSRRPGDDKRCLTRRELILQVGKAAYVAPALTVLGLVSGHAQANGALPSGCPPIPDPDDPNCVPQGSSVGSNKTLSVPYRRGKHRDKHRDKQE